jgi:uncharacterized protein (TIGR01777 family)
MMKVLVSGSHGLIGSALVEFLYGQDHDVVRLVRKRPKPDGSEVYWNPQGGAIDSTGLEGMDAVVNLAGESLSGRWTDEKKRQIRDSRIKGTRLLSEALAKLSNPPKALVSTSASGYYGNRGNEILTEETGAGTGFLADLCVEWEAATEPAAESGIRVVITRNGIVLSPKGGALEQMLLPFKLGIGGRMGSGVQYMSWIAIDDLITVIDFALTNESIVGPINTVSPNPVTNREFAETLGRVLSRPTILSMPGFMLRLAFGEMADEALLTSQRILPRRLLDSGFTFHYPDLEPALRYLLGDRG